MNKPEILASVKEVRESTDAKEIAQLLSGGNWIAIYAINNPDGLLIVLGRI